MTSPHTAINPDGLPRASGFSHVLMASQGRTIFLGGQAAHDANGKIVGDGIVEQFEQACANVVVALASAGAQPEHLVSMLIYVTDGNAYRARLSELGDVYRGHFGKHYPAIAFFEVSSLFDPDAKVELVCTAVVPD
jgi:enamine deaminase RidA (YjgF/YER057c/UK114 family)